MGAYKYINIFVWGHTKFRGIQIFHDTGAPPPPPKKKKKKKTSAFPKGRSLFFSVVAGWLKTKVRGWWCKGLGVCTKFFYDKKYLIFFFCL